MRRFAAVLISTALGVTACAAAGVPSSTDTTIVTNGGFVQARPSAPAGPPSADPAPGVSVTVTQIAPDPAAPARATQPGPDGCGSGTGYPSNARPLCPPP